MQVPGTYSNPWFIFLGMFKKQGTPLLPITTKYLSFSALAPLAYVKKNPETGY